MYYKNSYKEASLQLIKTNQQGQYEVNDEALKIIRGIPEPMAVISVAGLYRTGKSYLLNRVLLNRSDGFNVGPTVNACTKGLWVWGKPIIGRNKQNELVNVLLIDSEGFGAVTQDSNHDMRIFALTLLLSSCFLYNSVGNIDEIAIENVGLVTNIAKSIRVRNDDSQVDDFFPQFYWVLRDFSLQLTSGEGQQLTTKQYLERALEQNSQNDDKNRTRKALTSYFPERDCITLVRPLTNQQNLQELDKLQFEKLRPQFVQQVIMMRKKILNNLTIKKFFGKTIDGQIFCQVVEKYVSAINQGAVPQIQNIWNYISRNECQRAANEALKFFEDNLNEKIIQRLPVTSQELEQAMKSLIQSVLAQFKKRAANFQGSKQFKKQLQEDMEKKLKVVRIENDKEIRKQLERCLEIQFQLIDRKIKANDFKSIAQLMHQLDKQSRQFGRISPIKGTLGSSILNEYILKKAIEGAEGLVKIKDAEVEKLKTSLKDMQKKTETDIKQLRSELNSVKSNSMIKVSKLQAERSELLSKEQSLKQALLDIRTEKQRLEQIIQNQTKRDKSLSTKSLQDLRSKLSVYENKAQESERKLYLANSEFEKKQALLTQKIDFQEKMIEELRKKQEKSYDEAKTLKQNYTRQLKESNSKIELNGKNYQKRLTQLSDKNTELENELHHITEILKLQKQNNERLTSQQSFRGDELNRTIQKLTHELKEKEMQFKSKLHEKMTDDSRISDKMGTLQDTLKEKDEQIRILKVELSKQKALQNQKQQFFQMEIKQLRRRYEEQTLKGDSILKLFQSKESQKGQALSDIRSQYAKEIQQIQRNNEAEKRQLRNQIALLSTRKQEAEMSLRQENQGLRQQLRLISEKYESVEDTKNRLLEQNKSADMDKMRSLKLLEDRNIQTVKSLQRQIEQLKEQSTIEVRESQRKNEEALTQLKNFYEIQKQRLEKKLLEYQQKFKDFNQMDSQTLKLKFQQKCQQYEQQIESLINDVRDVRTQARNTENDYQCRLAVAVRQLESLREQRRQLKDNLETTRMSLEQEYNQTVQALRQEKAELFGRLEQLTSQLNKKDKQSYTLNHKKQLLQANLLKKQQALDTLRSDIELQRKTYQSQLQRLKQKAHKINDEYLGFKIDKEKQLALALQQKDFMSRRVHELQEEKERERHRAEERLVIVRNELAADYKEKNEKLLSDYNILEQKFQKSRKTWKQDESRLQKQLSHLERDKMLALQKMSLLETTRDEESAQQLSQAEMLTTQIAQLKEEFNKQRLRLTGELQKQRYLCLQLEEMKSQVEINYEKDRVLWLNKLQFVETQRDQAKQDLSQALRKFQATMSHISKRSSSEQSFDQLTKSIERKYTWQIETIKQANQKKLQQAQEKVKSLHSELKSVRDAFSELKSQKELQVQREKIQYMHLSQLSHLSMLQNNNQQFQREKLDLEDRLIRQKEEYSRRLTELERRSKQAEAKCSNITFGFEKQYVKWNIDRKCLEDRIEELIEVNQKLYRQLERYKNKEKEKEKEKPSAKRLFRLQ